MSELKAHRIVGLDGRCNRVDNNYYLKSEADKVIAEKDKEIAELKNYADEVNKDFEIVDNQNERLLKIVRHNKRKRCLAMARLCGKTVDHLNSEGYIYEKENHTKELTDCIRGTEFYDKWYHRWLALTEKFKPNKSTAQ